MVFGPFLGVFGGFYWGGGQILGVFGVLGVLGGFGGSCFRVFGGSDFYWVGGFRDFYMKQRFCKSGFFCFYR